MATLTARSTALNVWSDASASDAKFARFQTNDSSEFQLAYDSGDQPVRVVNLKFGEKAQTATQIVDALEASVSTEQSRALAAEATNAADIQTNASDISSEASTRASAITARINALAAETTARQSADTTLTNNLNSEVTARQAAVTAENSRATTAEGNLQDAIDAEEARAVAAELVLTNGLAAEVSRAQAAEGVNATGLASEITSRTQADANLQSHIDSLDSESASALAAEVARATAAENAIDARITTLIDSSPESLDQLTEIVADYTANGQTVQGNLTSEITRAQGEETAIKARLDTIEALLEALQNATVVPSVSSVQFTASRLSAVSMMHSSTQSQLRSDHAVGTTISTAAGQTIGVVTVKTNESYDTDSATGFRRYRVTVTIDLDSAFVTAYQANNAILSVGDVTGSSASGRSATIAPTGVGTPVYA